MNTNMNELNLNEMEQVNGGSVIAIAAGVIAAGFAAAKMAEFVYDRIKGK